MDVIDGTQRGGIDLLTQLPSESLYKNKIDIALKILPKGYGLMVVSFSPSFLEENRIEGRKILGNSIAQIQGQIISGFIKNEVFSIAIPYPKSSDSSHSLAIFDTIKKRVRKNKARCKRRGI